MTRPANTTPFSFEYQVGQRCLLKKHALTPNPNAFSSVIQPVEVINIGGKNVTRRKYFVKLSGNGCAHDRQALKALIDDNPYDKSKGKPEHYRVNNKRYDKYGNRLRSNAQYKAVKRIERYGSDTNVMPSIEVARKRRQGGGNVRRHRSEAREGICRTLTTLLLNMDIHSFRVGRPDASDRKLFYYHRNDTLAAESGLGAKRFQRSLELLAAAGIIKMKRQWEELKEGYKGKASAIWFTAGFMKSMGLLSLFNRTSEQLTKREKRNQLRDIKTPEQVQAEATDKLCQEASRLIVSKDVVRKDVKDLYNFLDVGDPPQTAL